MNKIVAGDAIKAAEFLGDEITGRYCPTGLSNSDNLSALIEAAQKAGCDFSC